MTPKGPTGAPVLRQEARDDRVVGLLARPQTVRGLGVQAEVAAPIVQGDARPRDHQAGAEPHIVALDHGNHVPLPVRRGQIDRSSLRRPSRNGVERGRTDPLSAFVRVALGEQVPGGTGHEAGIRNIEQL